MSINTKKPNDTLIYDRDSAVLIESDISPQLNSTFNDQQEEIWGNKQQNDLLFRESITLSSIYTDFNQEILVQSAVPYSGSYFLVGNAGPRPDLSFNFVQNGFIGLFDSNTKQIKTLLLSGSVPYNSLAVLSDGKIIAYGWTNSGNFVAISHLTASTSWDISGTKTGGADVDLSTLVVVSNSFTSSVLAVSQGDLLVTGCLNPSSGDGIYPTYIMDRTTFNTPISGTLIPSGSYITFIQVSRK